jgi:hypothetical protein
MIWARSPVRAIDGAAVSSTDDDGTYPEGSWNADKVVYRSIRDRYLRSDIADSRRALLPGL